MNDEQWYKGRPGAHTCLLFGEISELDYPQSVLALFGQEAYEAYQTYAYMTEWANLKTSKYICWTPGFELLYAAAAVIQGSAPGFLRPPLVLEEIGSTLFSCIDKIEKLERLHALGLKLGKIAWRGVEPSARFASIADHLHSRHQLTHYASADELPPATKARSLGRSFQATSYAFDTSGDFVAWLSRHRFSLNGIWFALEPTDQVATALGKRITLFGGADFRRALEGSQLAAYVLDARRWCLDDVEFVCVWLALSTLRETELEVLRRYLLRIDSKFASALDAPASDLTEIVNGCPAPPSPHAGFMFDRERDAGTQAATSQTFDFGLARSARAFRELSGEHG